MPVRMRGCLLLGACALLAATLPRAASAAPPHARGPAILAWLPERGTVVLREADGGFRAFDLALRELDRAPEAIPARAPRVEGADAGGPLELAVWSRRTLRYDPADGSLELGPAPWERAPRLRWGPGWLCVELRSAIPGGVLQWRRAGEEEVHEARFRGDANDGLTQRAFVEGLATGETLELRWRLERPRHPAPPPPQWRAVAVPAVDPAGLRPSEAWPTG